MYPEGIDVSLWQDPAYAAAHLQGRDLAIVKISQSDFLDPKRKLHVAMALETGVKFLGGYHWLDPEPGPEAQADLYLRNAPAELDFHNVDVEGRILAVGGNNRFARGYAQRFIAYVHRNDSRPILQYSSRGTWPGNNGQNGNWVADYTGDPERWTLLTRRVPWVIWQYGSRPLDQDRYKPDLLAKLCNKPTPAPTPTPAPGGTKVKFIQISASDVAALPSLVLDKPTPIETLDGERWTTIGPTSVSVLPGLPDAHSNRRLVVIRTGRFYADKVRRPTVQVAVLP